MVDLCIRSDLLKDFSPDPVAYVPAWQRLQLRPVAAPKRHARNQVSIKLLVTLHVMSN